MNDNAKLDELKFYFETNFVDFSSSNPTNDFKCQNILKCDVHLENETACTGRFGNPNSEMMVVAEAPSTSGGSGCKVLTPFEEGFEDKLFVNPKTGKPKPDNFKKLIKFLKSINNNMYPYFTDAVKCGTNHTSNKSKLTKRKTLCSETFLMAEINILKPKIIICLGSFAREIVEKLQNTNRINTDINIVQIAHFSNRASLTLSIDDKVEVIWPLQLKQLDYESAQEKISKLTHLLNKMPDNDSK